MPLHPASIIIGTTIAVIGSGYAFKKFIYDPHLAPYVEYWIAQHQQPLAQISPHARRRTRSGLDEGERVGIAAGVSSARREGQVIHEGLRRRGGPRKAGIGEYELRESLLSGFEERGVSYRHSAEGIEGPQGNIEAFGDNTPKDRGGRGSNVSRHAKRDEDDLDVPLIDLDSSSMDIPSNRFPGNHIATSISDTDEIHSILFDATPTVLDSTQAASSSLSSPNTTPAQMISPDYTHIDMPNLDEFANPFRDAEDVDQVIITQDSVPPLSGDVTGVTAVDSSDYVDIEGWETPDGLRLSYASREEEQGGRETGSGNRSRSRSLGSVISVSSDEDWKSDFGMSDGERI